MTVLERIRETAREKKNISITVLEQTLGYSNGSLAKAKDIPSSRILDIAIFLEVSTDYILTGKDSRVDAPEFNEEHVQLITLYSGLKKEQREAVFNFLHSFCSK